MFGYVVANLPELTQEQRSRYGAVYCGICRRIGAQSSQLSRMVLSYDMVFLALLLMSLYEPEEGTGEGRCLPHPLRPRPWVDNRFIRYAADMNVALAYYNALDNWQDEGRRTARAAAGLLKPRMEEIRTRYPRQCQAMERCTREISRLEKENCPNPDLPAGLFGELMEELLVVDSDAWEPTLRPMGNALGRFIYLVDAAQDLPQDRKKGNYNPFLAGEYPGQEEYLVLTMSRCTKYYEMLPLLQDKDLLDHILYSGVWVTYRKEGRHEGPL